MLLERLSFFFDDYFVFMGILHARGFVFEATGQHVAIGIILPSGKEVAPNAGDLHLPSEDVVRHYRDERQSRCRFNIRYVLDHGTNSEIAGAIRVKFRAGDEEAILDRPSIFKLQLDPMYSQAGRIFSEINSVKGTKILELGSRARSGNSMRHFFSNCEYIGLDVHPGPNVDVVGDVHDLRNTFGPEQFDWVYSTAVFEHLMMPWKAAIEINRVLRDGGKVFIQAPQTWPEHDKPWDFFRFSVHAWACIFNEYTGFRIIESHQGLPAHVVPALHSPSQIMDDQPGWMMSGVVAQKIGAAKVSWDVPSSAVADTMYPPGEVSA